MDRFEGGCRCGDIRIVASGRPYRVGICHCLDCRKYHGALFHASAIFPQDAVTIAGEARDYERLEFLGDRVLGLAIAEWLHAGGRDREGKLSQRLNALVSRQTCAQIARDIGLGEHILLGKQARDDGGRDSDNILGDVMEAAE